MNASRFSFFVALVIALGACDSPTPVAPPTTAADTPGAIPTITLTEPTPATLPTEQPSATRGVRSGFLQRLSPDSIRIMTYNVHWDSVFPDDDPMNHDLREFNRADAFIRVMRAIQPDVICLQEINYLREPRELGRFMARTIGSTEDQDWEAATQRDNVIATRFKLEEIRPDPISGRFNSDLTQATAFVDLPKSLYGKTDLFVICAHFKSGGQDEDISLRQHQADAVMAFLRDFTSLGEVFDLAQGMPFVILGDFNVYETDPHLHLRTLVRGDIFNEAEYGTDVQPDWDGTQLADATPSHNGLGAEFYTWRNDALPFPPGALDRIIYSDSVLAVENAFVLNTMTLTDEALAVHGLRRDDVVLDTGSGYYDHLPLVVDFVIVDTP